MQRVGRTGKYLSKVEVHETKFTSLHGAQRGEAFLRKDVKLNELYEGGKGLLIANLWGYDYSCVGQ